MLEAAFTQNQTQQIRIDKFMVPEPARDEFMQRLRTMRAFLKTLPGFVRDFVFEQSGGAGKYNFVTIAVWKSAEALDAAIRAVSAMHADTGYNRSEMLERLVLRQILPITHR